MTKQLQQGAKEISEKRNREEIKSKPAPGMVKGTAQIGDEPGKEVDEPGKGVEEIQEKANEKANETSEVSLQDSSLEEVKAPVSKQTGHLSERK